MTTASAPRSARGAGTGGGCWSAAGITLTVLVAEAIGAAVTGSLVLLADAGHMLTDVAGILLAVLAVTFASRPATPERTFGYYRLEILAAVVNAVLLFGIALFILWEAWQRWSSPPEVRGGLMLAFAAVGLVANIAGLLILRGGAKESLNVKGAYLEVLGDLLGSVAVIVAAIVIATTGWLRADVLASVAVAVMILPRTWDTSLSPGESVTVSAPYQWSDCYDTGQGGNAPPLQRVSVWWRQEGVEAELGTAIPDETAFATILVQLPVDAKAGAAELQIGTASSAAVTIMSGLGSHSHSNLQLVTSQDVGRSVLQRMTRGTLL